MKNSSYKFLRGGNSVFEQHLQQNKLHHVEHAVMTLHAYFSIWLVFVLTHSYMKYRESPFSHLYSDSAQIGSDYAAHIVLMVKIYTAYRLFEKMTHGCVLQP